ncbi:hypothetical protein HG530_006930 [Fusarium avenaceum]|nr:hypothetical protein HG530_006930 [Fusarium avenaceum]
MRQWLKNAQLLPIECASLKALIPATILCQRISKNSLPAIPHCHQKIENMVRPSHLGPLEALSTLGNSLGGHIADRERGENSLVVGQVEGLSSDVGRTSSCVGNLLPAWALSVVPIRTIAVLRNVDDTTTTLTGHLENIVQAKTKLGHLVHAESLDENICLGEERLDDGCIFGLAQINSDGALASVEIAVDQVGELELFRRELACELCDVSSSLFVGGNGLGRVHANGLEDWFGVHGAVNQRNDIFSIDVRSSDISEPEASMCGVDCDLAVFVLSSAESKDLVGYDTAHGV